MPTSLTLREHVAVVADAGAALVDRAVVAGLDEPVPTCPSWTARALLAHQSMVHRWATADLTGTDPDAVPNQTAIRTSVDDLPAYYREGLAALLDALNAAPADLRAMTFLADAPAPREFWARRQAHETTVHGVDALSARLGRYPTAAETGIGTSLAVDGLDELLRGFFSRGRSRLYDGQEQTIAVIPTDARSGWLLHVAERLTVADLASAAAGPVDATLTGSAAQLYLGLWNRGTEVELAGRPDLLDRWRAAQRIRWS